MSVTILDKSSFLGLKIKVCTKVTSKAKATTVAQSLKGLPANLRKNLAKFSKTTHFFNSTIYDCENKKKGGQKPYTGLKRFACRLYAAFSSKWSRTATNFSHGKIMKMNIGTSPRPTLSSEATVTLTISMLKIRVA
jgi:hypothetical protein